MSDSEDLGCMEEILPIKVDHYKTEWLKMVMGIRNKMGNGPGNRERVIDQEDTGDVALRGTFTDGVTGSTTFRGVLTEGDTGSEAVSTLTDGDTGDLGEH